MKKKSIFLLICFSLLVFIIGCGGGSKSPTNPTPTLTDPNLSPSAVNLIRNGDFELDLAGNEEGWGIWGLDCHNYWDGSYLEPDFVAPTFARSTYPVGTMNHILHFYALDCGAESWYQLIIPMNKNSEIISFVEFELKSDKDYFISLKAMSDQSDGSIYASLNDATTGNFEHYGGYLINTTTVLTTYTKFIMKGNGKKVRFAINLGNKDGVNTNNGIHFGIDDVKLLEQ